MERKEIIRKKIHQKRSQIPVELKAKYSVIIQKKLIQDKIFQEADEIFCYVNNEDEVKTDLIMNHAWGLGKKVAVPKVTGKGTMEFYYINSMKELAVGHYGILEPLSDILAKADHALMILPGIVFDRKGTRIGYGGGYYDRYLMSYSSNLKVALAYAIQITECIKAEDRDIPVDMIFTESEIIRC